MAVTAAQAAAAIRADGTDPAVIAEITRLLAVAAAAVDRYAGSPPEAIRDEAIIRLVGYLYDLPTVPGPGYTVGGAALQRSGGAGLLSPYRAHRIGVGGAAATDSGTDAPPAPAATIDDAAVEAIVARVVAAWARDTTTPIPSAKLDAVALWARDTVTAIPGGKLSAVARWALAADDSAIPPSKLSLAPAGPGMGGNDPRVPPLVLFKQAFDQDTALGEARIIQALSNAAAPTSVAMPAARAGRRLRVEVFIPPTSDGTHEFALTVLAGKAAAANSDQLTDANSVSFDGTSGATYRIARTAGGGLLFASDSLNTYRVTFVREDIQATPYVDFPAAPAPPRTNAEIDARIAPWARAGQSAPSGGGGLSQAQVDARVAAGVSDWAEQGNASLIPAAKLANAPHGTGGGLSQAQVDARITHGVADWAEEGNAELIPAAKLANAPQGTGGGSPSIGGVLEDRTYVDASFEPHIVRGVASHQVSDPAPSSSLADSYNRIGVRQFMWATPGSNPNGSDTGDQSYVAFLPKSALGPVGTRPTQVYARFISAADGETRDVNFTRAADNAPLHHPHISDTTTEYAYWGGTLQREPYTPAIQTPLGTDFEVSFYSDSARTTPLTVQTARRSERRLYVVNQGYMRKFARPASADGDGASDSEARTALARLMNNAVQPGFEGQPGFAQGPITAQIPDAERIDYAALKNRPVGDIAFKSLQNGVVGYSLRPAVAQQTLLEVIGNPAVVLDPAMRGILICNIKWSTTATPDPDNPRSGLSLTAATTAGIVADNEHQVFLSSFFQSDVYSATAQNGAKIGSIKVTAWDSTGTPVTAGILDLYIARNAANQLGYYFHWGSRGFGSGGPYAVQADVRISLLRSDVPVSHAAAALRNLAARADIPAAAGFAVGDIVNVAGELYELVDDTTDESVLRATAQTLGTPGHKRAGLRMFSWTPDSGSVGAYHSYLSKAALGSSPPARIYVDFHNTQTGETLNDIALDRRSATDTTTEWSYGNNANTAGLESNVGAQFVATFASDAAGASPIKIHTEDRFEKYDHVQTSEFRDFALKANDDVAARTAIATLMNAAADAATAEQLDYAKLKNKPDAGATAWTRIATVASTSSGDADLGLAAAQAFDTFLAGGSGQFVEILCTITELGSRSNNAYFGTSYYPNAARPASGNPTRCILSGTGNQSRPMAYLQVNTGAAAANTLHFNSDLSSNPGTGFTLYARHA